MRFFAEATRRGLSVDEAHNIARQLSNNDALMSWAKVAIARAAESVLADSPISYSTFQEEIANLVGVFCLTEDPVCAPMWAHYGADYHGFLVEFDASHQFFNGPGIHSIKPVVYEQRTLSDFQSMDESDLLLRKSTAWSYEKEWRTFRLLDEADRIVNEEYHLFEVPCDSVCAIILGEKCSDDLANLAVSAVRRNKWQLKGVSIDRLSKRLDIVRVEVK